MTTDTGAKKGRAAALMQQARALGTRNFEPTQNLLRYENVVARYTGYVVGQQSLEYAIALLETEREPEGDCEADRLRANAIINRVLEFQVRDPRHHRCGNFIWMTHWEEPRDPNAVAFLTPNLVYLYQQHAASLLPETRANLQSAFPLCAQALLQREVPYEYTNIKALTTLSQFVLAPLVPDSPLENTARFQWQHWVTFTAQYGIPEYNSPTYHPVVLGALEELWQRGPHDMRADFERLLEYFYFEFAARYHAPTTQLAGAMSRAYPHDLQTGQGLAALVAHLQWGAPYQLVAMNDVRWLRNDYLAPDEVRRIAFDKPLPLQIESYAHHPQPVRRTDYFAADYSLGTQNGYSGNQEVPLFLTACNDLPETGEQRVTEQRRSIWLQAGARDSAALVSSQDGSSVIGYHYYDQQRVRDNALLRARNPEQELLLHWHLGHRAMVQEVLLNGQAWNGECAPLEREGTLALRFGKAVVGLRFEADAEIMRFGQDVPLQLRWDNDELGLFACICPAAAEYVELGRTLGLGFYLEITEATENGLARMQETLNAICFEHSETLCRESAKCVSVRNTPSLLSVGIEPPTYLHQSSLAQLKPNDLLHWFQGADEAGREVLFGPRHS